LRTHFLPESLGRLMALATVGMHSSCRKERKNKNEEEKKREEKRRKEKRQNCI
jgi:hypothetical protein